MSLAKGARPSILEMGKAIDKAKELDPSEID